MLCAPSCPRNRHERSGAGFASQCRPILSDFGLRNARSATRAAAMAFTSRRSLPGTTTPPAGTITPATALRHIQLRRSRALVETARQGPPSDRKVVARTVDGFGGGADVFDITALGPDFGTLRQPQAGPHRQHLHAVLHIDTPIIASPQHLRPSSSNRIGMRRPPDQIFVAAPAMCHQASKVRPGSRSGGTARPACPAARRPLPSAARCLGNRHRRHRRIGAGHHIGAEVVERAHAATFRGVVSRESTAPGGVMPRSAYRARHGVCGSEPDQRIQFPRHHDPVDTRRDTI